VCEDSIAEVTDLRDLEVQLCRAKLIQQRVKVSAVARLKRPLERLDVLLRHSPFSIPLGRGRC